MYDDQLEIRWDPTLTSQERCKVLIQLANRYPKVRNFVETGTAGGETITTVYDYFDKLYTIEIVPSLFRATRQATAPHYPNIEFHLGDSTQILPRMLDDIDGPCFFWLDGHFCGSLECRGAKDTPIQDELEIILGTDTPHLIVIDDARLFGRDPAYPSLEWMRKTITSASIPYDFSYGNDMMTAIPKVWR